MLAKVFSAAVWGVDAYPVEVEVNATYGKAVTVVVGLPDTAVKESCHRVITAVNNSAFRYPLGRVTFNLAPADVKKEGPSFDLPMALGIVSASDQLNLRNLHDYEGVLLCLGNCKATLHHVGVMVAPKIVFLDTNIYDGIQYNFDSTRLKALVEMVPEHVSHLLLPESIQDEIYRHINRECDKVMDGIQSAQKKAGFVTKLSYWPEHKDLKNDVDEMKAEVRDKLELFLKRMKVVGLKYEKNNVREVMGWYDKLQAPFNEAKNQIADALAIQTILMHSAEHNEAPIAVISNDEHMAAACAVKTNLIVYKTLDQFLDDVNKAEDFVKKIKRGLEKQSFSGLLELVNESFADLYFTHDDDENARVSNPRVLRVKPYNFLVVDGDEKTWCDISMTVEIVYVAHVRIGDLDSVSRDSETRTTYFNHWLKGEVTETIDLKGILNCHIDPNTQEITKMGSFTFDDDMVIISERPPEEEEEEDYYQPYRDQGLIP